MTHPNPCLEDVDWNPAAGDVVLLAVDADSIERAQVLLATLPATARGTVFVEIEHLDDAERLEAPPRFSVRWLVRDRGQGLQQAVDAWLGEMLAPGGPRVYAWVSSRGPARVLTAE